MARELSVQAVLSANTTPFANGMKQASQAAQKFSSDMKRIRAEISQPLFVPRPGQRETGGMVLLSGTVAEAMNLQIARAHRNRFEIIRQSEERALRLRQFYVRKEAEMEAARARRMAPFIRAGKRALGGASLGALAGLFGGDGGINPIGSAINIGGSAAAGGLIGGVPGAIVGGTIAALGELQQELRRAANAARGFADAMHGQRRDFLQQANERVLDSLQPFRQSQRGLFGRDAAAGEDTPFLGGIFGMVGSGRRFERQRMFRRGLAQGEEARRKIMEQMTPEARRAAVSRLVAEGLERERQAGRYDESFGARFMRNLTFGALGSRPGDEIIAELQRNAQQTVNAQQQRLFRDLQNLSADVMGMQGRRQAERGVGRIIDVGLGFANAGLNFDLGALVPNAVRDPAMKAAQQAAAIWMQTRRNLAENEDISARTMALRSQMMEFSLFGAPSAQRGTNEYLRTIHDQPKDIKELVKIAKEQLAAEKKLAAEIGQEINRQRVTVRM